MTRKAMTKQQCRALFAKTGNQCSFPGCSHPLVDDDNLFIAQVCHIEAVRPGGPRYNSSMTDDERCSIDNLMVMCYRHHRKTDDTDVYDVARLKKIKKEHEMKWAERPYELPDHALQQVFEEQMVFETYLALVNMRWTASFDLAMHFRFNEDASYHLDKIRGSVSDISGLLDSIIIFLENLSAKVAEFMDDLGYDSAKYRSVPYYDNPFELVFWEALALGLPNSLKEILFHSKALEAHICFQKLRMNPNDRESRTRLDELKPKLLDLASSATLHD